jgi:uncharacterized protein (UPF0333 family)
MKKTSQSGAVVLDVLLALAFLASLAFGIWAYSSRQDYKSNSDKKAETAVAKAKADQAAQLQKKFDEEAESPYKIFKGSSTYGTISFQYPKTWSAYVDESNSSEPINAYFYPDQVPGVQSSTAFALRVELLSTPYPQVVQQYSQQMSTSGLKATAYIPPKLQKTANVQPGTRFDGAIGQNSQGAAVNGSLIALTVRDKTLVISTQSTNFLSDFNNVILPSLTFAP